MILLLGSMLLGTLCGALLLKRNSDIQTLPADPQSEETSIPAGFKGSITDEYDVPKGIMDTITAYMDAYYRSLFTLEETDLSGCFGDERMQAISDYAIRLLRESRKAYDFDFRLTAAHYDLHVVSYRQDGDFYQVDLLEDDYLSFAFLEGIESQSFDIENSFTLKQIDGSYRIIDLEKIQGYYMAFYDADVPLGEMDQLYDFYYSRLKDKIVYDQEVLRLQAQNTPYQSDKSFRGTYDRQAAVAYLDRYYHLRNREWYNFTDEGGNCQNYASQVLLAGGIPMDYEGEAQWKCYIEDPDYDPEINEEETAEGRTRSWVHVSSFYDYAKENEGNGLAADVDVNPFYAQPGDIIMVGQDSISHTTVVSKVVNGHVLVNSNSIDMKDYPIEAYTYLNIRLIKILGYN